MTLRNAFDGLATDEIAQAMLLLLAQIAEKMPRVDIADRLVVTLGEAGALTGTSVVSVTTLTGIGSLSGYNSASYAMPHAANAGAMHIYNQIQVTP